MITSALTARKAVADRSELNLSVPDVDGLVAVLQKFKGRHLNLVLHGAGGELGAAEQVISLLRGRYESIRAVVPSCAMSAVALIACACDAVLMPTTAVIGATDDNDLRPVSADGARDWFPRNCTHPDRTERVEAMGVAFAVTDGPRSPLSASLAEEKGLPVTIVPHHSALGRDLEDVREGVEDTLRRESVVRLIDSQKGPEYFVEG